MRKLLVLLPFVLMYGGLSAQTVPNVQYSMLTKITATWCPFCGTWGWDVFEELLPKTEDKAIVIANHYSGDLRNNTAAAIASNLNTFGQPLFYINNTNQNVTSSNRAGKIDDIIKKINDNYEATPTANSGILASLNGNTLTIKTKTKFFKSTEGTFYLGVYIIENEVINFQSSRSNAAVHKNVLRGSVDSNPFGELIINGSVDTGTEVDQEFTTTLDNSWNPDKIKIATIIWQKVEDTYLFFNGYMNNDWQSTTSTKNNTIEGVDLSIRKSISEDKVITALKTNRVINELSVRIFNSQGNLVTSKNYHNLSPGTHLEAWTIDGFPAGAYFIHFSTSEGNITRKFVRI